MLNRLLTLSMFYGLMSWVLLIIPMLQMRNLEARELKGSAQAAYCSCPGPPGKSPLGIFVASPHRIPSTSFSDVSLSPSSPSSLSPYTHHSRNILGHKVV